MEAKPQTHHKRTKHPIKTSAPQTDISHCPHHSIRRRCPLNAKWPVRLQERATGKRKEAGATAAPILDLCRSNPSITIPEMAEALGLTEDGINFHLRKLRKQNLLSRIGGRKFGHWEVVDPENP
jgi:predicted HTH transcriptional regulator